MPNQHLRATLTKLVARDGIAKTKNGIKNSGLSPADKEWALKMLELETANRIDAMVVDGDTDDMRGHAS